MSFVLSVASATGRAGPDASKTTASAVSATATVVPIGAAGSVPAGFSVLPHAARRRRAGTTPARNVIVLCMGVISAEVGVEGREGGGIASPRPEPRSSRGDQAETGIGAHETCLRVGSGRVEQLGDGGQSALVLAAHDAHGFVGLPHRCVGNRGASGGHLPGFVGL